MSWTRKAWVLWALGITAVVAPGCSSQSEEEEQGTEDELTTSTPGQWVVDLAKAKKLYGETSKYFFGLAPDEVGLCKKDANGAPEAACAKAEIVWDQLFSRAGVNFPKPGVGEHDAVPADYEAPVLKLEDDSILKVKGKHINIIPLIKDTDPTEQQHLRQYMQNGDVLVFFHPEQTSMRNLMDRRASHVAMHYDYTKPNGEIVVHHIDNPNSYGPQYNFAPDRQMPFHVFRYKPKAVTADQSKAYGLNARNWAFMTDDRSPFADFFTLTLQKFGDLDKFKTAALKGEELPKLYCSGLAYTNLNLGINFPITSSMLRREGYTREETQETLKADVLAPAATQGIRPANSLAFESYTMSELTTAWLDNTFAQLPAVHAQAPSRKAIAMKDSTQQQILQGLAALQWSDAEAGEKAQQGIAQTPVGTPERVKAWADAYGLPASETAAWLGRNAEIQRQVNDERVDTNGKTPMQVLNAVELATVSNKFVPPRIWMDEADHRQWAPTNPAFAGEAARLPTKPEVDMVYVGTVINCEILASSNGNQATACRGTGNRIKEFSEGGADTATYPHYAVGNGGERTHRRFDASPFSRGRDPDGNDGPRSFGKGTRISLRATAADASDVMFLFHTPEMNDTLSEDLKKLGVKAYDAACTDIYKRAQQANTRGTCAPKRAIVLDLKKSEEVVQGFGHATGKVEDENYTFDLTKVCSFTSPTKMKCTVAEQSGPNGAWQVVGEQEVSREIAKQKAFVSTTVVDLGKQSAAPPAPPAYSCPACPTGGAHFNQWVITIRDDK